MPATNIELKGDVSPIGEPPVQRNPNKGLKNPSQRRRGLRYLAQTSHHTLGLSQLVDVATKAQSDTTPRIDHFKWTTVLNSWA